MDVYYINHLNEKILLDSENVILSIKSYSLFMGCRYR